MANNGSSNPFINILFLTDTKLFVNLFYNKKLTHYHFIYDLEKRDHQYKDYEVFKYMMTGTSFENFPIKSIYNTETDEIYCFYRLGQIITAKAKTVAKDVKFEHLE